MNTLFVGQNLIHLPLCPSTNSYLAQMLQTHDSLFEGTIVLTDTQTAGRGQKGNAWEAEPYQNFTLSVLLKPHFLPLERQFYLNMAVTLAVKQFLAHFIKENLHIKWSNDILYKSQKIAGVLIENTIRKNNLEYSIIGLGININQKTFENPKAVSLANITQKSYILNDLLPLLCQALEHFYLQLRSEAYAELKNLYMQSLYLWQKNSFFYDQKRQQYFEGVIQDLDQSGRLLVQEANKLWVFDFKEIVFLE